MRLTNIWALPTSRVFSANEQMMDSTASIISLITDFGDRDEYVGVMKGAILRRAPRAVIVDICHHIAAHDIRQASAMMAAVFPYFPSGTLHLVVVDPGVGSQRDIVLARARECDFLCPDNGLLTGLIRQGLLRCARRLTNRSLFADAVSATFHGRDIMGPVAGFLASGGAPEQLGPEKAIDALICRDDAVPRFDEKGWLQGTVLAVDRFGNVITDIGSDLLTSIREGDLNQPLVIEVGRTYYLPVVAAYSSVPAGQLLATIGSRNTLEIAVNQGRAADLLGISPAAAVRIARKKNG